MSDAHARDLVSARPFTVPPAIVRFILFANDVF